MKNTVRVVDARAADLEVGDVFEEEFRHTVERYWRTVKEVRRGDGGKLRIKYELGSDVNLNPNQIVHVQIVTPVRKDSE